MDLEVPRSSRGSCTILKNVPVERLRARGASVYFETSFPTSIVFIVSTRATTVVAPGIFAKKLEAYPFCITIIVLVILVECSHGDDVDNQGSGYDPEAYS